MTSRTHRRRGLALLAWAILGLAACGGSGDTTDDGNLNDVEVAPPLDPTRTPTDTPAPAPAPGADALRPDEAADTQQSAAPGAGDTLASPTGPADTSGGWTTGLVDGGGGRSTVAQLTGVRTGGHEDFDRIVLEFADGPLPSYHLEYIDRPVRQCGSGNVVELPGDAWLSIRLDGTRGHDDAGATTVDHGQRSPGLPNLQRLAFTCDFEAVVEVVAAVGMPGPFRVQAFRDPARLVVDIRR